MDIGLHGIIVFELIFWVCNLYSGSEKGVFWKRGLCRKVHFLEILDNLEILEILKNPQTVENKGESDFFLEILENLENLEILEIPPVKDPFRNDPFFRSRYIDITELVSN